MENSSLTWQQQRSDSEPKKAPSGEKLKPYIRKKSNLKNRLLIDVLNPTQKTMNTPLPANDQKQLKEVLNSSNNRHQYGEPNSGERLKIPSKPSIISDKSPLTEYDNSKQRVIRPENMRLPNLRDVGDSEPTTEQKPTKNGNCSVDYGYVRNKNTVGKAELSFFLQLNENQGRYEFETQTSKIQKNNPKFEPLNIPPKKEVVNVQDIQKHYESLKIRLEDVEKDSYRTLTSGVRSNQDLRDSIDDIRFHRDEDHEKIIKDIVEKHVERAYKRIDLIKRNFKKNNKRYMFHVNSDF
jgi:hypothetical protein